MTFITQAGVFTRHWTAAPDKQMRLARTHRPRSRLGRRTPGLAVAVTYGAHANPAAAKCKPHTLLLAKQESADVRRARKLGQCHELVHHLLQQLAPRGHYTLGTCAAARVSPLDEQPPGPPLDRQPWARSIAAGHAVFLEPVEQCGEVGEAMRHALPARPPRHLEAQHVRHVRPDVDQAVARHLLPAHHTHLHRRVVGGVGGGAGAGGLRRREALLLLRQCQRELRHSAGTT
eukprot:scaffold6062_cov64-Phaeocystis_antarctica.AAC.2